MKSELVLGKCLLQTRDLGIIWISMLVEMRSLLVKQLKFIVVSKGIRDYMKKEKLGVKKIIGLILVFIAVMLVLLYGIVLEADYLNWYAFSSPFYLNVIYRSVEFLLPAVILIVVGVVLIKNKKK